MINTLAVALLALQMTDPAQCPMHEKHMKAAQVVPNGDAAHGAKVDHRHDALSPSHEATRHTFRLFDDGGAIELRAIDAADGRIVDGIRKHLRQIAEEFSKNDFRTPAFVHGRDPAGIAAIRELHASIEFRYEPVEGGGRIRLKTANRDAIAAIHEFMKFQIVEHRTGQTAVIEHEE